MNPERIEKGYADSMVALMKAREVTPGQAGDLAEFIQSLSADDTGYALGCMALLMVQLFERIELVSTKQELRMLPRTAFTVDMLCRMAGAVSTAYAAENN